jgi:hypothetical protein
MDELLKHAAAVLTTTAARWLTLTTVVSPELLGLPPAVGEWSATECLLHLIDTERSVFPVRIRALLAGQDFPGFNPNTQDIVDEAQSVYDLAELFARLRGDNLELLRKLSVADLQRQARHAELGMVTLSELIHQWAGHDLMHLVQAEQALMQPFIQGSGPWQPYFAAHLATVRS